MDESDDEDEVMVMGVTIPNTIPVPGFIVAEIIDKYDTNPAVLLLRTANAIKHRARIDGDPAQAKIRADLASYVVRWLFGLTALKLKLQEDQTRNTGVATMAAYSRRSREWSSSIHRKYLAAGQS